MDSLSSLVDTKRGCRWNGPCEYVRWGRQREASMGRVDCWPHPRWARNHRSGRPLSKMACWLRIDRGRGPLALRECPRTNAAGYAGLHFELNRRSRTLVRHSCDRTQQSLHLICSPRVRSSIGGDRSDVCRFYSIRGGVWDGQKAPDRDVRQTPRSSSDTNLLSQERRLNG